MGVSLGLTMAGAHICLEANSFLQENVKALIHTCIAFEFYPTLLCIHILNDCFLVFCWLYFILFLIDILYSIECSIFCYEMEHMFVNSLRVPSHTQFIIGAVHVQVSHMLLYINYRDIHHNTTIGISCSMFLSYFNRSRIRSCCYQFK